MMRRLAHPAYQPGLRSLIWPMSVDRFLTKVWQRKPLFVRGGEKKLSVLKKTLHDFDLNWILRHANLAETQSQPRRFEPTPEMQGFPPMDVGALTYLYRTGVQLYIACSNVPGLGGWIAALSRDLNRILPTGRVDMYATHRGGGIGFHFDANDNFTIQLVGKKEWTYSETKTCDAPIHSSGSFPTAYAPTTKIDVSPSLRRRLKTVVLAPGDMLYIPRGFIHATNALEQSLSLDLNLDASPWATVLTGTLSNYLMQFEQWRATASADTASVAERLQDLKTAVDAMTADLVLSSQPKVTKGKPRIIRCERNPFVTWQTEQSQSDAENVIVLFTVPGGHTRRLMFSREFWPILKTLSFRNRLSHSTKELLKDWDGPKAPAMTFLRELARIGFLVRVA